jgi:hypothetical protein
MNTTPPLNTTTLHRCSLGNRPRKDFMMTRVIQDSDDEFEEEEDDIDGPIEIPIDAPTKQDASNVQPQSGEHGTGSTSTYKIYLKHVHPIDKSLGRLIEEGFRGSSSCALSVAIRAVNA